MRKIIYQRPAVKVEVVKVEKGFATTGGIHQAEKPFIGEDLEYEGYENTESYGTSNGLWDLY